MPSAPNEKSQLETILPSVFEAVGALSGAALLEATIEAIREHRVLTDKVDIALQRLEAPESGSETDADLTKAYDDAVLNNQAQIVLVAALTQKLGYVPHVPTT